MKIEIGKSKLHGKGLIAKKKKKKGEVIFVIKGKMINFLINNKTQAKIAGFNWIGFKKNTWIDPINFGLYLNHSCEPNSAIKGKVTVVAIQPIKSGEEITTDYSLSEADIFWKINCSCQSRSCRKIIKSIQFLPDNIFNKYKSYIPDYFRRIYSKFKLSNFKNPKELEIKCVDYIKKDFGI